MLHSRGTCRPAPGGARQGVAAQRARPVTAALLALLWSAAGAASAAAQIPVVIVPDDYPTIQAALDAGAATIHIRRGTYSETPVIVNIPSLGVGNDDLVIRGLVPAGSPPDSLPVIEGLVFDDLIRLFIHSPSITVTDLRFAHAVRNAFNWNPYSNPFVISFLRCVLDGGINDSTATAGGQLYYELHDCTIDGPVTLGWPDGAWFDSCLIRKPIVMQGRDYDLRRFTMGYSHVTGSGPVGVDITAHAENVGVGGNTFEGYEIPLRIGDGTSPSVLVGSNRFIGPGRYAVQFGAVSDAYFSRNYVMGYEVGLHVESRQPDGIYTFVDNRIEHCAAAGIDVVGPYLQCYGDTILWCGTGAVLRAAGLPYTELYAEGNVILSCSGDGLSLQAQAGIGGGSYARISGNVVGRCGGSGIVAAINPGYAWGTQLKNNTSFLNAGSGYVINRLPSEHAMEIDHNIGHGNARHGLEVVASDSTTIGCNDWFANVAGAVQGIAAGATDLAVDPRFCYLAENDVHLAAKSPLADAAGCGLIGALGIGCETTPVLVELFTASRREDGGIAIQWRIRSDLAARVRIERAGNPQGPWTLLTGTPQADGELVTLVDPDAEPGRAYWYRLVEDDPLTGAQVVAMTSVEASPLAAGFALEPIAGNPGPGPFTIRFRAPAVAPLDLEVFDLQGRRIAQLASGAWPAGTHEARWSGHDAGGRPLAGIYLVRYRHPGGQATQCIVLIR